MKVLKVSSFWFFAVISIVSAAPYDDDIADSFKPFSNFFISKFGGVTSYRLPNNSIPLRYDLFLKTDIEKEDSGYSGEVKIHVKIIEATKRITMNIKELTIENIDLLDLENNVKSSELRFKIDEKYQFLTVFLPTKAPESEEFVLDIKYSAKMSSDDGFSKDEYKNENDETKFAAATCFNPIYARRVMPCFDEPQIRAVINVRVQHAKSYNVISNTPIVKRSEISGTDYVISEFEETPSMPIYQLSVVVSDFKFISNNDTRIEQRIYGSFQSNEKGEYGLALSFVSQFVKKLEDYFKFDFPSKKFDHVAMEETGYSPKGSFGVGVFYKPYLFLQNPKTYYSVADSLTKIAKILTNQYFGLLLSPKWWSDLWLTEGLTNFYANYFLSQMYPYKQFVEEIRYPRKLKTYQEYRKVNEYVEKPSEIESLHDFAKNLDVEGVLSMFHTALSPKVFDNGVKYFLNSMKYSSVTPEDFYRELQKAYDEIFPDKQLDIRSAFSVWESFSGFPVINVERSGSKFILTQESNYGGDEIYTIPISYATKSNPNFDKTTPKVWMTTKSIEIEAENENDWIVLNLDFSVPCYIKYSEEIYIKFIDTLQNNHKIIPLKHRINLFKEITRRIPDSSYPLPRIYSLPVTESIKLFDYMQHEDQIDIWTNFGGLEEFFRKHLYGLQAEKKYEQFIQLLIKPHLNKLGFNPVQGELKKTSDFRKILVDISCKYNQPECLTIELEKLKESFNLDNDTSSDFCQGTKIADEITYEKVVSRAFEALNNNKYEINKYKYGKSASCVQDKKLLRNFIRSALNDSDTWYITAVMQQAARTNSEGLDVILEILSTNSEYFKDKINSYEFSTIVEYVNSQEHIEKFKLAVKNIHRSSKSILEQVEKNQSWLIKNLKDVESWFDTKVSNLTNNSI